MQSRPDFTKTSPKVLHAMLDLQAYVGKCGLEADLLDLIEVRASQINGCAYCIDMHWKDARSRGATEQRLYALDAWRESPFYSEREQAALAWTEAVTMVVDGHVPDAVYEQAQAQFGQKELVDLTLAVVAINGWNRLCVAFRAPPGVYQPKALQARAQETKSSGQQLHG